MAKKLMEAYAREDEMDRAARHGELEKARNGKKDDGKSGKRGVIGRLFGKLGKDDDGADGGGRDVRAGGRVRDDGDVDDGARRARVVVRDDSGGVRTTGSGREAASGDVTESM